MRASVAAEASAYYPVLQATYVGYFGRPADPGGLEYYAKLYQSFGAPTDIRGIGAAYNTHDGIRAVIDSFGLSAESAALYPGDDRAFVTAIYRNLFNRAPDQAGLDYWANTITSGAITRANAAIAIMGGALGSDGVGISRKQQVATHFTQSLNTPAAVAAYSGLAANAVVRSLLARVDFNTVVAEFQPAIESTISELVKAAPKPPVVAAPAVAPLRTGGSVTSLISAWSGNGFQLLTTAPEAPTYRRSAHAGAVWDDARQTLWIFGAETHKTDMDNAVYGWRASDGQFIKHYDADPSGGYMMDGAGIYWSSAEKVRPWAMHTYRRLRWVAESSEIEVMFDPNAHAGITPIFENPAHTTENRAPAIWYYNVVSGKWRHNTVGQSAKLAQTAFSYPVGYDANYGWFTGDGSKWHRLTPSGDFSTTTVSGKSNGQYHSYMHVRDGVAYRVGGNADTSLYSKHPLNNIDASEKFLVASYPALAGFTVANMASAMMTDGRIVIFPTRENATHAMILDPVANTVTPTGHSFDGMDTAGNYELGSEWSTAHNAAILVSRRFKVSRVYAYRP